MSNSKLARAIGPLLWFLFTTGCDLNVNVNDNPTPDASPIPIVTPSTRPTVTPSPTPTVTPSPTPTAGASWQETLKLSFDHAETFDTLADWKGSHYRGEFYYGPSGSLFNGYSNWASTAPATNWVQNFGPGTQISGKSLLMDYNNVQGPSRMFTYIGNGAPSSGYDSLNVFFRIKFSDSFFYLGHSQNYMKFFSLFTGFTSAGLWGSPEDRVTTCDDAQTLNNYGANFMMMNWGYYGALDDVAELHPRAALPNQSCWSTGTKATGTRYYNYTGAAAWIKDSDLSEGTGTFDMKFREGEWLGLEFHASMGPDSGNANHDRYGDWEYWVYDSSGNVIHHWKAISNGYVTNRTSTGLTRVPSSSFFPTHRYNKIEIGGNALPAPASGTYFVDDFVVDATRIGPAYFELLNRNR